MKSDEFGAKYNVLIGDRPYLIQQNVSAFVRTHILVESRDSNLCRGILKNVIRCYQALIFETVDSIT